MKKIVNTSLKEMLKGKKVKELSAEEREYLERTISGDYRGEMKSSVNTIGRHEVTIDFENGLSVGGWFVFTEKERYYEFDEEAVIYDPAE